MHKEILHPNSFQRFLSYSKNVLMGQGASITPTSAHGGFMALNTAYVILGYQEALPDTCQTCLD